MSPSIFISYRRSDAGGHAGRIFDHLRKWFDDDEIFFDLDAIDTGDVFPERIDDVIRSAKAVLVVIGPDWLAVLNQRTEDTKLDLVRREVAIAIERQVAGKARILPVLVGNTKMPSCKDFEETLREELGRLPDYQALAFQGNQADWNNQFEQLLDSLANVPGVPAPRGRQPLGNTQPYFPTALVDQKIETEVDILYRSRFFSEFDGSSVSLALGRRLVAGELSGGTDAVRSRALTWCARLLSHTVELDKAEEYLTLAKSLGAGSEIDIADAFIASYKGNKRMALDALADIGSPASRSAALMVVRHHEGTEGSVDWLKAAGIDATDLDADGKLSLLMGLLELFRWEAAREMLDALTEQDLDAAPALHYGIAITHLLSTVPTELRPGVLNQVPFEAADFPLASHAAAIVARRTAHRHFIDAAEAALQLNCPKVAIAYDEYALWLELKDPEESDKGRVRLEEKFRDLKSALRFVPFGLRFGIKMNLAAVEQEIEAHISIHGGMTRDAAMARLALVYTQKSPEDAANYIARHNDGLSKCFDKKLLLIIQIDLLSQAGRPERANACLNLLLEDGLSEAEEHYLRSVIGETEGTNPIEARKERFKQTESLGDLISLVEELESGQEWNSLCEYRELLFKRTRSVNDAELLANALSNAQKTEQLGALLQSVPSLLAQSRNLQLFYAWSLYHGGALLEARSELAKLNDGRRDPSYRSLEVSLRIALGDWNALSAYVANEYKEKDKRSARDLMDAAQLAFHVGSPYVKDLIFAAVGKEEDAGVFAAAYFLASCAGWEDDAEVGQWLHKAAALSGEDGPIQKLTIKDVLDLKPEWDRRESETWQRLSRSDMPMYLAAKALNRTLIDLMLFPALANLLESDPRRRGAISAYSGKRQPTPFDTRGSVGMDPTALLTLSFLNLLEKTLDAFETVYVPHSTLTWLFEEKQKASFHQPSRIRDSHQVRNLVATDLLEQFLPSTVGDSDLSAQVGDALAMLIAEAEKVRDEDNFQCLVVRSSPVHRLSSLMEEEADLTRHAGVITSCLSVVDKLRQNGQLTAGEAQRARDYMQIHEKPWPNQPEITDGATLYLDHLAITYFLHLGILGKLKAAGYRPVVSPEVISDADKFISYENISGKVEETLERIRVAVSSRIESGKIKVGRRDNVDETEVRSISDHPSHGVFTLAEDCDAVIWDDRCLNQHAYIDTGRAQVPLFTTLDLLDTLTSTGSITPENQLEYRTRLRRAGYFFVPVSDEELVTHLAASMVEDGKLVETAELKAIRENILCVRMSSWIQLPRELPWLDTIFRVFIRVLKSLWNAMDDHSEITTRSDWILDQLDIRGWAHSFEAETGDYFVKTGRGLHIMMLFIPPSDTPQDVKDAYWSWMERRVLVPIKEQFPDLYAWIVESQREQISEMADMNWPGMQLHDE